MSTDSLVRTPRLIEGWLWKEADTKKMLQLTRRHIRYVRIVFNSGKMNVKEDKADLQMRSFSLADMVVFRDLTPCLNAIKLTENSVKKLLPCNQLKQKHKVEVSSATCAWPYSFRVEFPSRGFTFSARTAQEGEEWARVFRLITKMNKLGLSCTEKNPYLFEQENLNRPPSQIKPSRPPSSMMKSITADN